MSFDGDEWSAEEGENESAEVTVRTSPEEWATLLAVKGSESDKLAQDLRIEGSAGNIQEFLHTIGARGVDL